MERKFVALSEIETLAAEDDKQMRFKGYGAVFGNVDSYGDVIEQGAFAKTLAESEKSGRWPAMLAQHGGWGISSTDMTPIGVWESLTENGTGLKAAGVLAPTPRGTEIYTLMKMTPRPAIDGLSIGYIAKKFTLGTKQGEPRRLLHEVELMEISPVTFPANGKARVTSVKSADFTERDFERWLMQDAGLTRSEARIVLNQGFKSLLSMQDAGSNELAELADALKARAVF
jgi:HK97 family phage prohead protease